MGVYVVYRSPDIGPTGKYLKRFDDETVVGWFHARWDRLAGGERNAVCRKLKRELGCGCDELADVFCWEDGGRLGPPGDRDELFDRVDASSPNEIVYQSEHCLQVFTYTDEPE